MSLKVKAAIYLQKAGWENLLRSNRSLFPFENTKIKHFCEEIPENSFKLKIYIRSPLKYQNFKKERVF